MVEARLSVLVNFGLERAEKKGVQTLRKMLDAF
jgi:hypothetical protein